MRGKIEDSGAIDITGKVVVVSIVLLLFVVVFVFFLHFYATWCWYRRLEWDNAPSATRRRRRFDFAAGHQEVALVSVLRGGLDPAVLKTIPILVFDAKQFGDGLECAVCLCDVSQGEKARILPKCNHGFHVDCIDMWFQSHSTCPLCRNPVSNQSLETATTAAVQDRAEDNSGVNLLSREAPNFPTNVLIWGNETQVSTFEQDGSNSNHQCNVVITEPSSSSADGVMDDEEEQKSSVPTRIRSIKRLLSKVNPSSSRNLDIEQGGRGG